MTRKILAALLVLLPLLLAACGGDDKDASSKDDDSSSTNGLTGDAAAVNDALVKSLLDPDCSLLTDDYLLELALFAETVEDACTERMNNWVEPQFDEDDILITDIAIDGDVATAVVGSELVNITTTYELTLVDGTWLVSCDDFTCDDLAAVTGSLVMPVAPAAPTRHQGRARRAETPGQRPG